MSNSTLVGQVATEIRNAVNASLGESRARQYQGLIDQAAANVGRLADGVTERLMEQARHLGASEAQAREAMVSAGLLDEPRAAAAVAQDAHTFEDPDLAEIARRLQGMSDRLDAVERTAGAARSRYGIE